MERDTTMVQTFFLIFSSLLMLVLFLSKYLAETPRLHFILSEPAMTLIIGMVVSFFVSVVYVVETVTVEQEDAEGHHQGYYDERQEIQEELTEHILSFQTEVFFLALLPPILFNSGYQLQKELFYRHFAPIALFACLGTVISGFGTGGLLVLLRHFNLLSSTFNPSVMELLTYGALISATDTVSVVGILQSKKVDPHLFSLVFGESALNDAVALVLFKTLSDFLAQDTFGDKSLLIHNILKYVAHLLIQAIGSPLLGIVFAFGMGLAFKHVDMRHHGMLELCLYILPIYIPFILSELLQLSGMITIFVTGIFARRYMAPNVSEETRQHSEMLFRLLAFLAETCIFLELGLSVFGLSGSFQWQFIGWALVAALLGRALSIYPLASLYNHSLTEIVVCLCSDDASVSTLESSIGSVQGSIQSRTSGASVESWTTRRETPPTRRDKRIPVNFMHMLWYTGLRGAVAYACARDFPDVHGHRDEFVAATMVIVLVTVILMGGGTVPLMSYLEIPTNVDETTYMRNWRSQRRNKGRFLQFEFKYIYGFVVRQDPERKIKMCLTPKTDNTSDITTAFNYRDADDHSIKYGNDLGTYGIGDKDIEADGNVDKGISTCLSQSGEDSDVFNSFKESEPCDATQTYHVRNYTSPFGCVTHTHEDEYVTFPSNASFNVERKDDEESSMGSSMGDASSHKSTNLQTKDDEEFSMSSSRGGASSDKSTKTPQN